MILSNDKLMDARCRIQILHPWYGTFSTRIDWIKCDKVKTIGVNFKKGGRVNCYYNHDWCNNLTINELIAVIIHEIEHVVRLHPIRTIGKDDEHHVINNIAQDWLINGTRHKKEIENLPDCGMFMPSAHGNKDDVELWNGINLDFFNDSHTSEETAKWLISNSSIKKLNNGWALILNNGRLLHVELHDDHNIWSESDASSDEIRQTVKEIINSTSKTAGSPPGHLEEFINKIQSSRIHYSHLLRNLIGRSIGQKRRTYARINRKRPLFGVKGTSSHGGNELTIMVDVSGSMYTKILEIVFGEIESISQKFKINLIEFDSKVQKVTNYKKGDWRKISVLGRGGTNFNSALTYIEENNMVADVNIILTDGQDLVPRKRKYSLIWGIVGSENCKKFKSQEYWGDLLEIDDFT